MLQRCTDAAAAAAQLRQHAGAVGGEEAQGIVQQLINHIVTEQDMQRQAQAKV